MNVQPQSPSPGFRPGGFRATFAQIGVVAVCVGAALVGLVPEEALDAPDPALPLLLLGAGGGLLLLTGMVLSVVFVLLWFHNAHKNLPHLRVSGLRWSPGWAAGGFFVPFLNLVRPYQVMKEVWQASDPDRPLDDYGTGWMVSPVSPLVPAWWGLWLVGNFVSNFLEGATAQMPGAAFALGLFDAAVFSGAGVCLVLLIHQVEARQAERWFRIHRDTSGELRETLKHAADVAPQIPG